MQPSLRNSANAPADIAEKKDSVPKGCYDVIGKYVVKTA